MKRISIYIFAICLAMAVSANAADVTLAWDANSESYLGGYRVHYGTTSKTYTTTLNVQNVTQYTIPDLEEGVMYFFAVTAYGNTGTWEDGSKVESDYSDEIAYTIRPEQVTIYFLDRPQRITAIFDE